MSTFESTLSVNSSQPNLQGQQFNFQMAGFRRRKSATCSWDASFKAAIDSRFRVCDSQESPESKSLGAVNRPVLNPMDGWSPWPDFHSFPRCIRKHRRLAFTDKMSQALSPIKIKSYLENVGHKQRFRGVSPRCI